MIVNCKEIASGYENRDDIVKKLLAALAQEKDFDLYLKFPEEKAKLVDCILLFASNHVVKHLCNNPVGWRTSGTTVGGNCPCPEGSKTMRLQIKFDTKCLNAAQIKEALEKKVIADKDIAKQSNIQFADITGITITHC